MSSKNQNTDKSFDNLESVKNCMVKILKSPSNLSLVIVTYVIWSMLGMRYSSNQNFDMTVMPQYYVILLSAISIIAALINHNTKLVILAIIGAMNVLVSLLTVVISKVGITWFDYPIGYYLLCPISIFLFLLQIKQITCFAWSQYCTVLNSNIKVNVQATDIGKDLIKENRKNSKK